MAENIPEDRPLAVEEIQLIRWLLEHGSAGAETPTFLAQLNQARVVSRCPCGCASINFAIAGQLPPSGTGLQVLSDYQWVGNAGAEFGVFVFAKAGVLSGLEVWSIDGLAAANHLPKIESLNPIEWNKK